MNFPRDLKKSDFFSRICFPLVRMKKKSGHHYFNGESFIRAFLHFFSVLSSVKRHNKNKNTKIPLIFFALLESTRTKKQQLRKDIKNRINLPSIRYVFMFCLKSGKWKIYIYFQFRYIKNRFALSLPVEIK